MNRPRTRIERVIQKFFHHARWSLNDLTRSIDFTVTNAERGATVAGSTDGNNKNVCQTRILSKGIEQLRDLRDEVLRQRAQMRQSYMAALNQANLSANYAGLLRERDRDVGLARVVPEVLPQALERGRGRDSAPRRL